MALQPVRTAAAVTAAKINAPEYRVGGESSLRFIDHVASTAPHCIGICINCAVHYNIINRLRKKNPERTPSTLPWD